MNPCIADILAPGGLVSQKLDSYEERPEQLEMSEAVHDAFRDNQHLIVEAGTGVGKSFAYLAPAILSAVKDTRRTIISTHTIALQEQLIRRDLPFLTSTLEGHLDGDFSAVLGKRRNN